MNLRKYVTIYEAIFLFLLSFIVLIHVATYDHIQILWDEFYHILAARSWAANGTLRIADGVYDRAPFFTILVGWLFRIFGESIEIARLPSMLAGSLFIVAVFLWTGYTAGRLAAWITALLFCFSPGALEISLFIRFYALQGLTFWIGSISIYILLTRLSSSWMMAASAAMALLAFYVALHLQLVTVIGLLGLGLWVSLQVGYRWRRQLWRNRGLNWRLAVVLAPFFGLVLVLIHTGLAAHLLETYRSVAGWNATLQNDYTFYHRVLLWYYPTLWTLFPLAALFVIARKPEPGIFCLCVFGTAIVLHSFGGMKEERYIYYAMPFFFVIWGIVLAELRPYIYLIGDLIRTIVDRMFSMGIGPSPQGKPGQWIGQAIQWAGMSALVVFLIASNTAFPTAYSYLSANKELLRFRDFGWREAREELEPWLNTASVILVTEPMHALYYLGDYDYSVQKAEFFEFDGQEEFDPDPRTGRPVITTRSMRMVLTCFPDGLFVNTATRAREGIQPYLLHLIDGLDMETEVVHVAPAGVRAVRWKWRGMPHPKACSSINGLQSTKQDLD